MMLTFKSVAVLLAFIIFRKCDNSCIRGMPLIQISQDVINDVDTPKIREEVHLEDFFWTGSGDGPPEYLKNVHTGISRGKDIVVKTETVLATVYVDGNNEIDIPICLDCPHDDGGGGTTWSFDGDSLSPLNYSITDRRYWLLTVMSGFYTLNDNPMLEEKLARLYRLAFTRQQSKHLGINGANQISGLLIPTVRDRRAHNVSSQTEPNDLDEEIETLNLSTNKDVSPTIKFSNDYPSMSEWIKSSEELDVPLNPTEPYPQQTTISTTVALDMKHGEKSEIDFITVRLVPWEFVQDDAKSEKQLLQPVITDIPQSKYNNVLTHHQTLHNRNVRVVIHNLTQITENDVQRGSISSVHNDEVTDKIDDRPVTNQTELIYSVFVNGRPVLAVSAANDMKFVSTTEVSEAIGNEIIMKAEPYLREPQATPLAPATRSGTFGVIDSIQNNTALVIVSSIAIILLLLLLTALLLMTHSRARTKNAGLNRSETSIEGISSNLIGRPTSINTAIDSGRTTVRSRDVGIQNFLNEPDIGQSRNREAHIHFPGPPLSNSRRDSLTSSDNTSDSSVYCPINPPTADVQRMLDQKAVSLFDRHNRRHQHQYDRAEGHEDAVYTRVKTDAKRYKTKRRYISENRVGSLEASPEQHCVNNSSGDEIITGSINNGETRRSYEDFEKIETYNPHNTYHRNKLLYKKQATQDKQYMNAINAKLSTSEAINNDIIRNYQSARSSDTGSIGSFLSMASVKAFPKGQMPEPLNRVLDPVFVTYYDNVDNSILHDSEKKDCERKDAFNSTTIATIENFPSPKAPPVLRQLATQSDNPDSGVIGPIVWERHKKLLNIDGSTKTAKNNNDDCNSINGDYAQIRDPAAMRHHYEDLLEGAIQKYSSQNDDLPMPLPIGNFTNNRKPVNNRGSSAGGLSLSNKKQWKGNHIEQKRPSTARAEKTMQSNSSTLPPTPTSGAWGGYSSRDSYSSSILRPMSAGPFHHPDPDMSAQPSMSHVHVTPLIEAIQTELRKFQQNQI